MSAARNTAKCIARFEHDGVQHRLLAKGKWSEGYEDEYVIERLGRDELGDARWDRFSAWHNDDRNNGRELRLISALKSAQREQRGDLVEKIAAFVGTFSDGIAIADAIREGRFE